MPATNSDGGDVDRGNEHTYRRRYLDEDDWEEVDAAEVRRALGEAYYDVGMALEFLHKAARIRTPAAMYQAERS